MDNILEVRPPLSKAFIALVWMAATIPPGTFHPGREFDVIELFSGKSRIARAAKLLKYRAMAQDITLDEAAKPKNLHSCMDINSSAGFTFFGFKHIVLMGWATSGVRCILGWPGPG